MITGRVFAVLALSTPGPRVFAFSDTWGYRSVSPNGNKDISGMSLYTFVRLQVLGVALGTKDSV